ncbi:MAG TPA: tetratricopeptide repeat protein [Nitrospiraceae bacterium]|nr:tetratricopeptide repeat protein [Nitrospiraceae bacterium]
MTDLLYTLIIPDEVRSYLAILGLLLCWKLHAIEIRRRRAVSTQLYLCLSKIDPQTCTRCRMAHLHVFTGRMPREVGFRIHCSNRDGCRCALIPITRQWPVAKRLRRQMPRKSGSLQLSNEDLHTLLHEGEKLSDHDRLAQTVLRAMLAEETNPTAALKSYRQAIAQVPETSIALQQAAAYMRLAEILERSGDFSEALQVTRTFLKAFSEKERYYLLAKPQYNGMLARQRRLIRQFLR